MLLVSDKLVVRVELLKQRALVQTPEGETHYHVLTDSLLHKLNGLSSGYFYAKYCATKGYKLLRLAPFSAWVEAQPA
jgi:hypothetical protein